MKQQARHLARGTFISFEGSEGCGKSTQIQRLATRLARKNHHAIVTREPGGTPLGDEIRQLLQFSSAGEGMASETELLLFTASRAQLVRSVIAPALESMITVLADRFLDSTTVYQGVARRLDLAMVDVINRFAAGSCEPDITFILDLDVAAGRERLRRRPQPAAGVDRMEHQSNDFYERCAPVTLILPRGIPTGCALSRRAFRLMKWRNSSGHNCGRDVMAFSPEAAFDLLRRSWERDRLSHALLITGPAGSGKRELCERIAALVTSPREAASGPNPDIHAVSPESKSRRIVIEQVRNLEAGLHLKAAGKGLKVGIVWDADRLQPQASNAFLKTLEEPPDNSLLMLVTALPESLLDTIRSRCVLVPLQLRGTPEPTAVQTRLLQILAHFFSVQGSSIPRVFNLTREFTQCLGEARLAIQGETAGELKLEESLYRQTTDGAWLKEREDYYKGVTESRYVVERSRLVETLLQWWMDALRQKQGSANLDFPANAPSTKALGTQWSTSDLLGKISQIEILRDNLGRNIQEALAIEVAFLRVFGP